MFSAKKGSEIQSLIILGLIQAVIYATIWIWNEYVATYISLIFPVMILVIMILSKIADWIEPSNISGWYYRIMIISILIPVIISVIFYYINNGRIYWLEK